MQLSTMTNIHQVYREDQDFFTTVDCIQACAEVGYRVFDLSLSGITQPGRFLNKESSQKPWIKEVRTSMKKYDVKFLQAHGVFYGTKYQIGTDKFNGFYQNLTSNFRLASEFDIPWMVLHPLYDNVEDQNFQDILTRNITFFKSLGDIIADSGVNVAIENMASGPFQSADSLLELITEIGNEGHFGICWDTGHANLSNQNQVQSIRKLGNNLKTTHITDNRGVSDDHLLPYSGNIQWDPIVQALSEINYQGVFSFEVQNATKNHPVNLRKNILQLSFDIGMDLLD